jgi:hypothetical protein
MLRKSEFAISDSCILCHFSWILDSNYTTGWNKNGIPKAGEFGGGLEASRLPGDVTWIQTPEPCGKLRFSGFYRRQGQLDGGVEDVGRQVSLVRGQLRTEQVSSQIEQGIAD